MYRKIVSAQALIFHFIIVASLLMGMGCRQDHKPSDERPNVIVLYEQLFSLEDDPGEINDLSTEPAFQHVRDSLRSRLNYLKEQAK